MKNYGLKLCYKQKFWLLLLVILSLFAQPWHILADNNSANTDTIVRLQLIAPPNKAFNKDVLPENLQIKFSYTKGGVRQDLTTLSIPKADIAENKDFTCNAQWPIIGMDQANATIDDNRTEKRYTFALSSSTGADGKLTFIFKLYDLSQINTNLTVKYTNPYGEDLEADYLPTDNLPKVTVEVGQHFEMPLLKENKQVDMSTISDLEDDDPLVAMLGGVDTLNNFADNFDLTNLQDVNKFPFLKINDKTEGSFQAKNLHEDKATYSYKITYEPTSGTTITLNYQPKLLEPVEKNGQLQACPTDYKRVTFSANQKGGKIKGIFATKQKAEINLDVRADLKWNDTDLQGEMTNIEQPKALKPNSTTEDWDIASFEAWTPALPNNEQVVETSTFNATYKVKAFVAINEPKITDSAGAQQTDPDYVKYTFKPSDKGLINGKTVGQELNYWLLKGIDFASIKDYKADPSANQPLFQIPTVEWKGTQQRLFIGWTETVNGAEKLYKYENNQHELSNALTGTVSDDERTFTAKYTTDEVIYYEPANQAEPTNTADANLPKQDSEGNQLNIANYVIVAFKSEDTSKGILYLDNLIAKEKQAGIISALVKKDLTWDKLIYPSIEAKSGYNFKEWKDANQTSPEATAKVTNGEVLTAYFSQAASPIFRPTPYMPAKSEEIDLTQHIAVKPNKPTVAKTGELANANVVSLLILAVAVIVGHKKH